MNSDTLTCEECTGSNLFSPMFIVFIIIISLLVPGLGIYIYFKVFAEESSFNTTIENDQSALAYIRKMYQENKETAGAYFKQIATTLQIITSSAETFQISFPSSFSNFIQVFSIINVDFVNILPLSCSYSTDYVDKLIVTTLIPILAGIVMVITEGARIFYTKGMMTSNASSSKEIDEAIKNIQSQYMYVFLILSFTILPSVTTTIFQAFPCENIDPKVWAVFHMLFI